MCRHHGGSAGTPVTHRLEDIVKNLGTAAFVKATSAAASITAIVMIVGAGRKF